MNEIPPYQPDFEEYIRQVEPEQKERALIWRTAIGLQQVDGLQTSDYLKDTVKRNIEGEISINEVQQLVREYYIGKANHEPDDDEKQEADKATANIAKILAVNTLDFSTSGFIALHRRIFDGVFKHAGRIRDYDITKKEFVLRGGTVNYLNWEDLRRALDYDIAQEKQFSYRNLTQDEVIEHIARFVAGIWQIHPFREGNTRTTAVFAIQYLRSIGFDINNDAFASHSWYFRNALVRANFRSVAYDIDYSPVYLERFFRNLLLGENWDLKSRYLVINPPDEYKVQPRLDVGINANDVGINADNVGININDVGINANNVGINEQKILQLIAGNPCISAAKISEEIGITSRQVERLLAALKKKNIIQRLGAHKNGHWMIVSN